VDSDLVGPPETATLDNWNQVLEQGTEEGLEWFLDRYDGPFCESSTCLFITHVPDQVDVMIRGEFNDWEEVEMIPLDFAQGFFYYFLEDASFMSYAVYKLYAGDEWFRDSLNPYFRFSDVSVNSAVYKSGSSRLALVEGVYSSELDNSRNLYVYLPAAHFKDPLRKFPVMYMQDGFNVFDNPMAPFGSWNVNLIADELIAVGDIEPLIIVGIDTDDRINEYLYSEIILDNGNEYIFVEPKLDLYCDFLVNGILPLVAARWPVLSGREDTAMAGSSFGGISSMYIAWTHADVFGKVAALSSSFWIGESEGTQGHASLREIINTGILDPKQLSLRIYLDSGAVPEGDPMPNPYSFDGRVYSDWTRNALIKAGYPNRLEYDEDGELETPPKDFPAETNPGLVPTLFWAAELPLQYSSWDEYLQTQNSLLHVVGAGHYHNEAAWEARFPMVLRYLFGY
jgi:predicted alpha/beta superfamily hydrolase